jgi:hypothetical protein
LRRPTCTSIARCAPWRPISPLSPRSCSWLERGFAGADPKAFLTGYGVTVEIVGIKHR